MGLTGIEPISVTDYESSQLQQSPSEGAAESGAVEVELVSSDERLQYLIEAWPELSEEIQVEILQLIRKPSEG